MDILQNVMISFNANFQALLKGLYAAARQFAQLCQGLSLSPRPRHRVRRKQRQIAVLAKRRRLGLDSSGKCGRFKTRKDSLIYALYMDGLSSHYPAKGLRVR